MRGTTKQLFLTFESFITLYIIVATAIFGCAERKDEIAATLKDNASDINLYIDRVETRGQPTVKFNLEPEAKNSRPCPVFELQATVNGERVPVSNSGYEIDETGIMRCLYPTFTYPIPEDELVLTNFFLGESSSLLREVLTRLEVQISDRSGDFSALFDRDLPQEIKMSIIRPTSGELRAGEEVEVEFDPAPEQIDEVSIVYRPKSSESPTLELNAAQSPLGDHETTNIVFTLPETDRGDGVLRIGITPWNRLIVACDFNACIHDTLELFYQNTPLFVSQKVVVSP